MPIITRQYYEMLCEAIENVADEISETRGIGHIPLEIKNRLIDAAITLLEAVDVEVKTEGDDGETM